MTAHPATFYHYEPLLHYDIVQARTGARAEDAVRTLKDLMHCNYTSLGKQTLHTKGYTTLTRFPLCSKKFCSEQNHEITFLF